MLGVQAVAVFKRAVPGKHRHPRPTVVEAPYPIDHVEDVGYALWASTR
jgi:hypothetical protein